MPCSHNNRHRNQNNQCCCCCCCCCCSDCCSSNTNRTPTSDHLLHALATQILLQSPSQSLPSLYSHPPPKPRHHPTSLHQPLFQDHHHGDAHLHDDDHQQLHQQQAYSPIYSLLHRVSALESSFPHLSPSPLPFPPPATKHQQRRPSTPPPPPPRSTFSSSSAPSLRDLAARRIQAAFRHFLLRRSQTLRHLKGLAAMKSRVAALRYALSDKDHVDRKALSEGAMDLLFRLDAIQSGDPMIREGKRAISRELTRILEFIDKVLVQEQHLALDAIEIAGSGENESSFAEDRARGSKGAQKILRPAKKVSFSEDGRKSRAYFSNGSQFPEELNDSTDQSYPVENLCEEVPRNGIRNYIGAERFHDTSDDERSSESSLENSGRHEKAKRFQNGNGKLGLTAPLPVQMEPRRK
ncbi:formin-like protein 13 [Canna indica]|uniref:Formin-like protein 13 n=1 Tax=Canna indica TaxID=4628 RepID=A0AAQ3K0D0_9LILI|nr:formin-like protein 13 [Canna indica]